MSTEPIHIMHIIHRFDTGGLENGVVNLINHLGEQGYRHSIATMKGYNPEFAARIQTSNVQFLELNKGAGNDLGLFLRLNKLLKTHKPDVLHTRNTATLECQVVGWWNRIPLRIHGEHGWDTNDMHGQNPRYQKLRRWMRPFIQQYIALSIEAKDYLSQTIRVKPQRINHICNGVNDNKFTPAADRQPGPFVFGCVGRLEDVKNHVLLAKAFAQVWQDCNSKGIEVKLHLIGDGSCREKVAALFAEQGCEDAVWMAGNRSDVAQQMQQFDAFVLPSLAEGISNTILEAMATGLPVIATSVGGNGDLVENEQSGYLVPVEPVSAMAEKMLAYAEDATLAQKHGAYGRRLVEQKFSIDAMTKAYAALYQRAK